MEHAYKIIDGEVIIRSDGASIPMDDGNRDYLEYLEWSKKKGNKAEIITTPEPKQTETIEERVKQLEKKLAKTETDITALKVESLAVKR